MAGTDETRCEHWIELRCMPLRCRSGVKLGQSRRAMGPGLKKLKFLMTFLSHVQKILVIPQNFRMTIFSHLHNNFFPSYFIQNSVYFWKITKFSHVMFLYIIIQYNNIILFHYFVNTPRPPTTPTTPHPKFRRVVTPQPQD